LWAALLFLFPGYHPDDGDIEGYEDVCDEVRTRFGAGLLEDDLYYNYRATQAGISPTKGKR